MPTPRPLNQVTVYCASSQRSDRAYLDSARRLGALLAQHRVKIIYGGGAVGSMGALADGALECGGVVVGVLPTFMHELEWGHAGLTELRIVKDLHARKREMLDAADAVIALPGGSGTLEELMEAVTWKRLGLYLNPIVLVNTRGFFDPLLHMLDRAIEQRFMDPRHRGMWRVAESVDDVMAAIHGSEDWSSEARGFAAVR